MTTHMLEPGTLTTLCGLTPATIPVDDRVSRLPYDVDCLVELAVPAIGDQP